MTDTDASQTAKNTARTYIVLTQTAGLDEWVEQEDSEVTATSAGEAIKAFASRSGNGPGTYVAVPARSWKPVTVKTQTVTTLTLEDAKP